MAAAAQFEKIYTCELAHPLGRVDSLSASPDGRIVALSTENVSVCIYDDVFCECVFFISKRVYVMAE